MGSLYHVVKKFVRLSYKVSIISVYVHQTSKPGFTSDCSDSYSRYNCCAMENYTCKCAHDADIFEGDGQYQQRYARCPKMVSPLP